MSRPGRGDLLIVIGWVMAGLVGGVLWRLLAPLPSFKVVEGQVSMGAVELMRQIDGDMVFVVLAAVIGLISGIAIAVLRQGSPVVTVLVVLVGSTLASIMLWQVGEVLSPNHLGEMVKNAKDGQALQVPLRLHTKAALLVLPVVAMAGTAAVVWIRNAPGSVTDLGDDRAGDPDQVVGGQA